MIEYNELRKIAFARFKDAKTLHSQGRYNGASYLCGYAVEVKLKARICKNLNWSGFPSTNAEFKGLSSFKTHNLDILLSLSGKEAELKSRLLAEWSIIQEWDPEARYSPVSSVSREDSQERIDAVHSLIAFI
ncbi:HEPN domain-containing protein [Carboxylicivirga linearis]|uniref:HEPN domain-containing protein n=1 Tax=Carboxylicivirga linearis TaxID=1628157 RepID=A0ABS5JW60_9BACT|nr:hypothetical protein [Carboxylicivirga linearis]MBS2099134.1 hypothetical protein [Carboxylicivirga linearis]